MSLVSVKAAVARILNENLGPGALPIGPIAYIDTKYPRVTPDSQQINAIVWNTEINETRFAGGRGGIKESRYRLLTHLVYYGVNDDGMTDDNFDAVVDRVLALYRTKIDADLYGNTVDSAVLKLAEEMDVFTPQPASLEGGIRRNYLELQAIIVTKVTEVFRA